MSKINLLPWRAELRVQQRNEFIQLAGGVAVVAGLIVGAVHLYHVNLIEYHQGRNKQVEDWTKELDKRIAEIQELEREKQRLLDRMRAIEQLQGNRPLIVRFFDELITSLPEGVSIKTISQNGTNVSITGEAQSYARVASFMNDLEASDWLANPRLSEIAGTDAGGMRISGFQLSFTQVIPKASEDDQ